MTKFRFLLSRLGHVQNSFGSVVRDNLAIRPLCSSSASGSSRIPLADKLRIGVRCFSTADLPSHIVLEMPALSPTMNQGNITRWRKKEGDKINTGDVLCEIETDKATIEFESLEEGFLARILTPEGSKDVPVGQAIAITVEDPEEIKNLPATISSGSEKKEETTHNDGPQKYSSQKENFSRVSPSAKLLIAEYGLDTSSLKASGPHGTLLKGDVLAVIKSGTLPNKISGASQEKSTASMQQDPHPAPSSPPSQLGFPTHAKDAYEDLPNSQIRKVIARRLVESKHNIPHFYLSSDVILDPLLAFRNVLKEQHNVKVSINDIIIKAVALSLRNVPEANAFWDNDKGEASLCGTVDISIAVATEKGLMTPIVRNADQKTLSAISLEVKELAEKARNGKLAPNEFQGGTFSISNLGMFPVDSFCAIINPPQASILAVGRGNKVVEPMTDSDGTERPKVVTKMIVNLSADNRVYDNEVGGKFLSALSANLSNVQRLLL